MSRGRMLSEIIEAGKAYSQKRIHFSESPSHVRKDSITSIIGDPSSHKLYKLFQSQQFADYTINFQGEDFPVHKCILASSCEYFGTYFNASMEKGGDESAWKENGSRIAISFEFQVPMNAFIDFLIFLYTDKISDETMSEYAMVMYELGDFFMMPSLLDACTPYLKEMLSVSNCMHLIPWMQSKENDMLDSMVAKFVHQEREELLQIDYQFSQLGERIIRHLLLETRLRPTNDNLQDKKKTLAERIAELREKQNRQQSQRQQLFHQLNSHSEF